MEFVLTGFQNERNVRRYTFQLVGTDRKRHEEMTVGADLALIRKHRIPLQELPLLCRRLLEAHSAGPSKASALMFTEKDMLAYAHDRAVAESAAEQKKRAHRKPVSNHVGQAWRSR